VIAVSVRQCLRWVLGLCLIGDVLLELWTLGRDSISWSRCTPLEGVSCVSHAAKGAAYHGGQICERSRRPLYVHIIEAMSVVMLFTARGRIEDDHTQSCNRRIKDVPLTNPWHRVGRPRRLDVVVVVCMWGDKSLSIDSCLPTKSRYLRHYYSLHCDEIQTATSPYCHVICHDMTCLSSLARISMC